MRLLIAVIPFLLLAGAISSVHADWPFADPSTPIDTTEHGRDYDRDQIDANTYVWTAKPERLEDSPNHFVDYKVTETGNNLRFESAKTSLSFNKGTCTIRFYDDGIINPSESPIMNSISTTLKTAKDQTDEWSTAQLDSTLCNLTWTKNEQGLEVVATKSSMNILGIGQEFLTTYKIYYTGMVEVIYSIHNNNGVNDYKYGFTQSFDGSFIVTVGDQVFDTNTIPNEVVFTKEQLEGKAITISKNGYTIKYDPQNYIHHYLWALKISPNHMNFDFTNSSGALLSGDTLEIDPTFTASSPATDSRVLTTGTTGAACGGAPFTKSVDPGTLEIFLPNTGPSDPCYRDYIEWTISSIPTQAHITDTLFKFETNTPASGTANCDINPMTTRPSTDTAAQAWTDIGDGTSYISNNNYCNSAGTNKSLDLGSSADTDLQAKLGSGWFAIGLKFNSETRTGTTQDMLIKGKGSGGTPEPTLQVTYTMPPTKFNLRSMQFDNSTTITTGTVTQKNATVTTTNSINSTGWASFPNTSFQANYNYTVKDSTYNFVVSKFWNYAIGSNGTTQISLQNRTNEYPLSCPPEADSDWLALMNGTDYHRQPIWPTQPSCATNHDVTWKTFFFKSGIGPAANQTTSIKLVSLDTSTYNYSPSRVLVNGSSKTFSWDNTTKILTVTGIQVGNGENSFALNVNIRTDNVTVKPTGLVATSMSGTRIDLSWVAPAQIHGSAIQSYQIIRDSTLLINSTGSATTAYSDNAAGPAGTSHTYFICAWNRIGCSPFSSTATNATLRATTGTATISGSTVGDVVQVNSTISITHASPSPVTVSQLKLYRNGTLIETKSVSVQINNGSSSTNFAPFWNQMTTADTYSFKLYATVSNSTGTVTISSANITATREYDPLYQNALQNPTVQGMYNFTVDRFSDQDGVHLQVNRMGGTLANTWQIECIVQDNNQAAQTRNESQTWQGEWHNFTNVGYFNSSWTGLVNTHAYITCFNDAKLFTTTSFTNSSLALFGIQIFDNSYGQMLGVPVGIFFLAMAGSLANKRTAPTWIVVVLGMAGTMATIGFFTFNPLIWGLALISGLLGVMVNQKVF